MPDYTQLAPAERRQLYQLARRSLGALAERLHYVRRAAQGRADAEIATIFEVDARTVREWLDRYTAGGVEALRDHPVPGDLGK